MSEDKVVKQGSFRGGTVRVPGDKSISHRIAMLSALASGESRIRGFLESGDCLNTLSAVESLGASIGRQDDCITVVGTGGFLREPSGVLDMGNSGTGIRLLSGILSGQSFSSELTGDASLCSRPMKRIQEPLELMGAKIELTGEKGCAPIRITGGNLRGIEYELPVASAQVKSLVLLAGLFAEGTTTVIEPKPTRDHTEQMLKAMGVDVWVDGARISVEGTGGAAISLASGEWLVPGDFSSAAYWITAGACCEGADIVIENVGLNPRRTALLDVLKRMGADIHMTDDRRRTIEAGRQGAWEPMGNVVVKGARLKGVEIGGKEIPNLIDELPLVAVVGALADGQTIICDASELRVKESDRISCMAAGLTAMGVNVEEKPDGMVVEGGAVVKGNVEVDSFGDHRVAMALSVLSLFADGPVKIKNTACIATSYPSFWKDLETVSKQP